MHRCSVCHSAYYCSKEHQQEHWRLRHRDECVPAPALKSIPASHEDEDQPLITQPPSGFNPLIDLHPTSVGPGSVAPIDIWDDRIGDISVCLDLNDVVRTEAMQEFIFPLLVGISF